MGQSYIDEKYKVVTFDKGGDKIWDPIVEIFVNMSLGCEKTVAIVNALLRFPFLYSKGRYSLANLSAEEVNHLANLQDLAAYDLDKQKCEELDKTLMKYAPFMLKGNEVLTYNSIVFTLTGHHNPKDIKWKEKWME